MKVRLLFLMCGVAGAAFSGPVSQDMRETAITVEKITNNLYLLRGGGPVVRIGTTGNNLLPAAGTTIAFVTSTGIVLVDPKLEGSGERIMDALRTVTDLPVRTIINTHFHGDHSGGNPDFPGAVERSTTVVDVPPARSQTG